VGPVRRAPRGEVQTSRQEQLLNALSDAFKNTARVTSEVEEDDGTHLVATVPLRDAYRELAQNESLTPAIPGVSFDAPSPCRLAPPYLHIDRDS